MINITYNNSVYSEDTTLVEHIAVPQKIHQVTDGGLLVRKGIKSLFAAVLDELFKGANNADSGAREFLANTLAAEGRNGFILAAGNSTVPGYDVAVKKSDQYPMMKLLPLTITQIYAGKLANSLGKFEYITTDATSCVSAHAALHKASLLIRSGELDRVVVISNDNSTAEEFLSFFREQGITMPLGEEGKHVDKFRLGQAANIIVLENDQAMQSSGNTAVGLLHGVALTSEVNTNPLGINEDGAGYKLAIDKVLEQADALPEDIDVVKTHATMTSDNAIENVLVKQYFKEAKVVNYKKRIGHTMGVSTGVEMDIAMREETGKIISLGAGMGNVFTAAIVEVCDGD